MAAKAVKFEIYKDNSWEFRWRIIHTNGQVIANSAEAYKTNAKAMVSVNSVKETARSATVEYQTA